jgi:hypothetical protein
VRRVRGRREGGRGAGTDEKMENEIKEKGRKEVMTERKVEG